MVSDEILKSVLNGTDSCILSYGQTRQHKTNTMFTSNSGIVPTSLQWLYHLVDIIKLKSKTKFTISLSALEILGKEERLKDLLISSNKETALKQFEFLNNNNIIQSLKQVKCDNIQQAENCFKFALSSRSCKCYELFIK